MFRPRFLFHALLFAVVAYGIVQTDALISTWGQASAWGQVAEAIWHYCKQLIFWIGLWVMTRP